MGIDLDKRDGEMPESGLEFHCFFILSGEKSETNTDTRCLLTNSGRTLSASPKSRKKGIFFF